MPSMPPGIDQKLLEECLVTAEHSSMLGVVTTTLTSYAAQSENRSGYSCRAAKQMRTSSTETSHSRTNRWQPHLSLPATMSNSPSARAAITSVMVLRYLPILCGGSGDSGCWSDDQRRLTRSFAASLTSPRFVCGQLSFRVLSLAANLSII